MNQEGDQSPVQSVQALSPASQSAYEKIASNNGMFQCELWKELDISSQKGSRLARRLSESGLISRQKSSLEGQQTYWLAPHSVDNQAEQEQSGTTALDCEGKFEVLTSQQQQALRYIRENNAVHQSELWKSLDISSRTATRITRALEEENYIDRTETTYEGNRTYLLTPAESTTESSAGSGSENSGTDVSTPDFQLTSFDLSQDEIGEIGVRVLGLVEQYEEVPQQEVVRKLDYSVEEVNRQIQELVEEDYLDRAVTTFYGRETFELSI